MDVTDRLIRDTNRRMERAGKQDAEGEETPAFLERKRPANLNEERGVFEQKAFAGINTQKSVFDRTALFDAGRGEALH